MKRFKNILVVCDGTEGEIATLQRAYELAEKNRGELKVMGVVGGLQGRFHALESKFLPEDIIEFSVKDKAKHLEDFVATHCPEAKCLEVKVKAGNEFIEVIREVLGHDHDLVVKTARGGEFGNILFGSTAMHLMRKCPCPVWVIKPGQEGRYRRICAAVDFASSTDPRNSLNRKIMDLSVSLAREEGSALHIVHSWSLPDENLLKEKFCLAGDTIDKWVSDTRKKHSDWLYSFLDRYDLHNLRYQVHLKQGTAHKLIPELAEKEGIDLIVMGTLSRTGVPGFLIGNTAEKVLHLVNCSVMAVKPDGFITPVTLDEE